MSDIPNESTLQFWSTRTQGAQIVEVGKDHRVEWKGVLWPGHRHAEVVAAPQLVTQADNDVLPS